MWKSKSQKNIFCNINDIVTYIEETERVSNWFFLIVLYFHNVDAYKIIVIIIDQKNNPRTAGNKIKVTE